MELIGTTRRPKKKTNQQNNLPGLAATRTKQELGTDENKTITRKSELSNSME
jgi:hypothetical protein